MKKIIILLLSVFLFFSCAWNNSVNEKGVKIENDKIKISASIVPIASIVNYIWWDFVDVQSIVPAWVSPHNFDLKSNQVVDIENSNLIIWIWLEHIDWFLQNIIWNKDNLILSSWIDLINWIDDDEQHNEEELQKENQYQKDPHIWLGIKNTKFIASKIKDKLVSLKPEKKDIFVKNYNNFVLELDKLIQWFQNDIALKKQKEFIVFHDAYNYLFNDLNIDNEKKLVFKPSVLSDLSSNDMKKLQDKIKLLNIKTVFKEPQFNDSNLQKFAEEFDLKILILDPIWQDISKDWYINNLKINLNNLKSIYE